LPVLVVDEAQHLRNDVLEDLRLLTNYAMDSEPRLCLLLVGLSELRRRLAMAVHESLTQRIVVRLHLSGLARDELADYLAHRLRLAGTTVALFEPAAQEALYQASHGLPRRINRIAHYALSAAALANSRLVTAEHLQCAVEDGSMKHRTIFVPMLMPKLSDQAAAHLIDILEQLLGIAQHHYGEQVHRWRKGQYRSHRRQTPETATLFDEPF
jgi:hypothetical protein